MSTPHPPTVYAGIGDKNGQGGQPRSQVVLPQDADTFGYTIEPRIRGPRRPKSPIKPSTE